MVSWRLVFLLQCLRAGHLAFYLEALGALTDLDRATVEKMVHQGGVQTRFRMLSKAGIPKVLHKALESALLQELAKRSQGDGEADLAEAQ